MISPEAAKIYEMFRNAPRQVDMDLHHQREAGEHQEDMTSEPEGVEYEDVPELGGYWATPANWDGESALVYLFGGGYVISSPHSRRKTAGHLANAAGLRSLVPNYRLGPEHPFPAAVEDAAAAFRWVLGRNFQPGHVFVGGDSSGGGLTAATLLKLRNDGSPLPGGGLMISPWLDLACTGQSLDTRADVDLTVTRSSLKRMAGQYLHGADPHTPLASPLYGDLSGLPPLLMTAGGDEALLDDPVRFLRAAGIAGVDATLAIGAHMQHVYPLYYGAMPEANAAVAMIGAWMRTILSGRAAESG